MRETATLLQEEIFRGSVDPRYGDMIRCYEMALRWCVVRHAICDHVYSDIIHS